MQITPKLKAVMSFLADDNEIRSSLKHVLAEPGGRFIATDGRRLVVLTTIPFSEDPRWAAHEFDVEPTTPQLLDADDLKQLLGSIPKAKHLGPQEKRAYLINDDGQKLYFVTWTPDANRVSTVQFHDDQYPDYQRVMPSGVPQASVSLNPKYLKDAAQAAIDIGAMQIDIDIMPKNEKTGARLFVARAKSETIHTLEMLIMPLRTEDPIIDDEVLDTIDENETWEGVE